MVIVDVPYRESGLSHMSDITGGTPYGATTLTGSDGARQPSENELKIARYQGKHVTEIASKLFSWWVSRASVRNRPGIAVLYSDR